MIVPRASTAWVCPLIVRSPSTTSSPSSPTRTSFETKRISGVRSASKNSGESRWP
jgi:hypothetical protein